MALFQKSPSTALEKFRAQRAKLQAREETIERELAALRNEPADSVLDSLLAADGAQKRSHARQRRRELEDDRSDLATALGALQARIQTTLRAIAHEKAEEIRNEAAKVQSELDAHRARTAELLKAVEEHDGQKYAPATSGWFLEPNMRMPEFPTAMKMQQRIGELLRQADQAEKAVGDVDESQKVVVIAAHSNTPVIDALVPEVRTSEPVPLMEPLRGRYRAS